MTIIKVATLPTIFHNDVDYFRIKYIDVDTFSDITDNDKIKYVIVENNSLFLLDYFIENDNDMTIGIKINREEKIDTLDFKSKIKQLLKKKQKIFIYCSTM